MEVHAHSHTDEKKNWKAYFWEFLMLFLAVFCGFLAENQREHMVEHSRERQFIRSYIEDLKSDTASIQKVIAFRERKMEQLDSLTLLLETKQIRGYENELYYLGRNLIRTIWFQSNDRTISQLKNSGSLRLIRNEAASDSMIVYQKLVDRITNNQEDDRIERTSCSPILMKMFNAFVFNKMVDINGINRISNNPPLRSYDPEIQLDLSYNIHNLKGSCYIILARLKQLNDMATKIIAFMKKEYHID